MPPLNGVQNYYMQIINFRHTNLKIDELTITPGEIWTIFGTNNSGVDCFIDLFEDKLVDCSAQLLSLPDHLSILSFQSQQELFEEELRNDDTDFLGHFDPGTLVSEFISNAQQHFPLLEAFDMAKCLNLGYRQLSSGQCRKLLLLREITGGATTIVLQNPYDGLDQKSCRELNHVLILLRKRNLRIILLLYSTGDIPSCCSHLAIVQDGYLTASGEFEQTKHLLPTPTTTVQKTGSPFTPRLDELSTDSVEAEELVKLSDGFARYGDNILFAGLNLKIVTGDHTLITGPNGCGKSTLLDIISGDNSNCYANNLHIFGKKRGTGESIWDLKKQMGLVSPSLHRDHRVPGSALHIILSGLFDSIGLYQKVGKNDTKAAIRQLEWLGLADKRDTSFRQLPFSEQRLVLIGRGLIKAPQLLILDEPTHGLDDRNREKLLILLEDIAKKQMSTIVYVSHREDEFRPFFTKQIELDTYAS